MHNKHRNDACRAENTLVANESGKRFFDTFFITLGHGGNARGNLLYCANCITYVVF